MTSAIDYVKIMQKSMRNLIADVLADVAKNGLPGEHHLYITFLTNAPGVVIPDNLVEQYPQDMTIVLQREFYQLEVVEGGFSVDLSFQDVLTRISIPFESIVTFADPAAGFGLRFDVESGSEYDEDEADDELEIFRSKLNDSVSAEDRADNNEIGDNAGNVVSLDLFRKK